MLGIYVTPSSPLGPVSRNVAPTSEFYDFDLCVFGQRGDGALFFDFCGFKVGGGAEDEGAEGEVVEDVAAVSPDVCAAVFAVAFVVEAVDGGDLSALVVAPNEGDSVWVSCF